MSRDRRRRALDIASEALDLDPSARAGFLREACDGDEALFRRVQALVDADAEVPRILQRPAAEAMFGGPRNSALRAGDVLLGRYRVVDRLGEGGMGAVFRAVDTTLQRTVALKCLRDSAVADLGTQRLLDEARAVSSLDHPNICPLYDVIDPGDGSLTLVMSYCDGPSLEERLSRGSIPVAEAVDIAHQIADGLSAAHESGVIHRDVKPSNIMLTSAGVRLVDFGIAKTEGLDLTRTGALLGTIRYMSPEQVRGETVDPRSDLWSLGVVLYEMIVGTPPFGTPDNLTAVVDILGMPAPDLREQVETAPDHIATLVARLLEKDPDQRPAEAAVVVRALQGEIDPTLGGTAASPSPPSTGTKSVGVPPAADRLKPAPWRTLVAVVAGVAVVGLGARQLLGPTAESDVLPTVVLADFQTSLADLQSAAGRAFALDLGASDLVRIAPPAEIARYLAYMRRPGDERLTPPVAVELAERMGAAAVVVGEAERAGEGILLSARLLDPGSQADLVAHRVRVSDTLGVLRGLDSLLVGFTRGIQDARETLVDRPALEPVTTSSMEALRLYSSARRAETQVGDLERAVGLYEEALRHDSLFAMAHRELGALLSSYGWRANRAVTTLQAARRHAPRVTAEERYLIEAMYHTLVSKDVNRAIDATEGALDINPDNLRARYTLGSLNQFGRRHEEALRHYRIAAELAPTDFRAWANQATTLSFLGRLEEALETQESNEARFPGHPAVYGEWGVAVYAADLRWDEVEKRARWLLTNHPTDDSYTVFGLEWLADLATMRGNVEEAQRLRSQVEANLDGRGLLRESLQSRAQVAFAHAIPRRDKALARDVLDEALRVHGLADMESGARPYLELASAYAWAGDPDRARQLLMDFEEDSVAPLVVPLRDGRGAVERTRGAIALAEGRFGDAILRFRAGDVGMCHICALPGLAMAYDGAQLADSAAATYRRYLYVAHPSRHGEPGIFTGPWGDRYFRAPALERLAELAQSRGDDPEAVRAYREFLDLWDGTQDPLLVPRVERARTRLAELEGA